MHQFLTKLSRANGNFYSTDLVNIEPITPPRVFYGLYNGRKFYQDPNENLSQPPLSLSSLSLLSLSSLSLLSLSSLSFWIYVFV